MSIRQPLLGQGGGTLLCVGPPPSPPIMHTVGRSGHPAPMPLLPRDQIVHSVFWGSWSRPKNHRPPFPASRSRIPLLSSLSLSLGLVSIVKLKKVKQKTKGRQNPYPLGWSADFAVASRPRSEGGGRSPRAPPLRGGGCRLPRETDRPTAPGRGVVPSGPLALWPSWMETVQEPGPQPVFFNNCFKTLPTPTPIPGNAPQTPPRPPTPPRPSIWPPLCGRVAIWGQVTTFWGGAIIG